MLKVYIDAATKSPQLPSGGGILIVGENLHQQLKIPLNCLNNHQAEFAIFIEALRYLKKEGYQDEIIFLYSDSRTMLEVVAKKHTTNPDYQPYLEKINFLLPHFPKLQLQWQNDRQHAGAHHLAQQALHAAIANYRK